MKELFCFFQFNGDNRSFCNQTCPYCHAADTPILMADFSWKPIQQVYIGESVIGYKWSNHRWRSVITKVTATFCRKANIVKLVTDKATTYCTHDHKWLTTYRGNSSCAYKRTEDIGKNYIRFISSPVPQPAMNEDYKQGWLNGVLRGDGCVRGYPKNPKTKYYFRLAVKDHEILERFKTFTGHSLTEYKFSYNIRAVQSQKKSVFQYMQAIMGNFRLTTDFAKGFLAGIFDAEGSLSDGGALRIANKNPEILQNILDAYGFLGFKAVLEPSVKGNNHDVRTIRLLKGRLEQIRFFALTNPAIMRKRNNLLGRTTHSATFAARANVLSITDCGLADVYNMTTETGNYVASGLISKNCYGKEEREKWGCQHYWNGDVCKWERAFERLNRPIYFVMSYGEAMGSHGFYDCVDMIGRHKDWTLNIITNLSYNPQRLIDSELGKDKRVFIIACWHPLGVLPNKEVGWIRFQKHLLMLREAGIKTHVLMVWYKPQIHLLPTYMKWFDANDIRFGVRRYANFSSTLFQKAVRKVLPHYKRIELDDYTDAEKGFLYSCTAPKVVAYGLDFESTYGKQCNAGKDMILVKHDGQVALCADCCGKRYEFGNIFDENFKLKTEQIRCSADCCGGDYGMLVLPDSRFGSLPKEMWNDTFVSQIDDLPQGHPVAYHRRKEMFDWLEKVEHEGRNR